MVCAMIGFNLTRAARLQIPIEPVLGTDSLFQGCQQAGPGGLVIFSIGYFSKRCGCA